MATSVANSLLVALENPVDVGAVHLGCHEADNPDDGEAADHGDGAAVDGVDGVAHHHVDHGEAHAPDEAGPDAGGGDAAPVESQHEGCQEGAGQGSPRDAHKLGDERGRVQCDEQRDGDEEHDQYAHHDDLAALNLLGHDVVDGAFLDLAGQRLLVAVDEVQRHGRAGGEHQRGQRGHGRREDEQDHEGYEHVGQGDQHGGHYRVVGYLAVGHDGLVQTSETAEEVAAAGHDEGEDGGDDGAAADGALVGDAIELTHHLGQSHRAQRGQHDHAQQSPRVGTEPGGKHAAAGLGGSVGRQLCQFADSFGQSALSRNDGHDDGHDAEEHDDALDEVVHGRGLVAAQDDVDGGEHCHDDDAVLVGNAEAHLEERRYAFIDTGGVGNEEHEGDDGGCHAQALVGKAGAEEVGHGAALNMLRHQLGATAQQQPRQQRADNGVADAYPCAGESVLPTKLSGVAHEDHGREITRSEGEGRQPRAHGASAQYETVHTAGLLTGVNAHSNHHGQEDEGQKYLYNHWSIYNLTIYYLLFIFLFSNSIIYASTNC